jgi:hypothetical protein
MPKTKFFVEKMTKSLAVSNSIIKFANPTASKTEGAFVIPEGKKC